MKRTLKICITDFYYWWNYLNLSLRNTKIPDVSEINPCVQGVPCNVDYINWLGFITIPFLALIAFCMITLFMLLTRSKTN